jgi:hypothetical protein
MPGVFVTSDTHQLREGAQMPAPCSRSRSASFSVDSPHPRLVNGKILHANPPQAGVIRESFRTNQAGEAVAHQCREVHLIVRT